MPKYRIDLTIEEWVGEDPKEAIEHLLDSDDGPWWEQLQWLVTDMDTGMQFEVTLAGSEVGVHLVMPNGETVPLDRIEPP